MSFPLKINDGKWSFGKRGKNPPNGLALIPKLGPQRVGIPEMNNGTFSKEKWSISSWRELDSKGCQVEDFP